MEDEERLVNLFDEKKKKDMYQYYLDLKDAEYVFDVLKIGCMLTNVYTKFQQNNISCEQAEELNRASKDFIKALSAIDLQKDIKHIKNELDF